MKSLILDGQPLPIRDIAGNRTETAVSASESFLYVKADPFKMKNINKNFSAVVLNRFYLVPDIFPPKWCILWYCCS